MTTTEETPKDKSTEREEFLKYGFEKGKNSFAAEGRKDVEVFKKKLNLKKDSNLNQLLETFGQVNLRNIHFYEKKIQDEQKQVRKFSILTLSIVAGLPIFIFIYTNYSETIFHTDIDDLSATGTVLSALLTSLLGVHQLLSNWTEKKRFRSNFFSAKTALMDILFELEEKYKSFDGEPPSDLAMVELQEDLTEAIKKFKAEN